jgi:adenosine deaminase
LRRSSRRSTRASGPASGSPAPRATASGWAPCSPRCGTPPAPRRSPNWPTATDDGVVGFDIAGAEAGYPPTRHLDAFDYLKRENNHFTIHAGEAFGLPSIWQALQWCGADRLGHGVRIIDDIGTDERGAVTLGRLASYVRDKRVPLEMCPTSNLQTGAAASYAEHPIGLLRRLQFRVTVNTDNRLMSGTSMSREFEHLVAAFGYTLDDMQWFTVNGMKSAFLPFDERLAMINDVIKPGYAELKAEWLFGPAPAAPPVASGSASARG